MHSTSVRESLIESPVILSPSKPQNIVSATTHSFESPAILSLPKHCFVCFRWRRRLSTLQFYSLPNRVDAVSSFAKDLRTLQFYSPPSHKASAASPNTTASSSQSSAPILYKPQQKADMPYCKRNQPCDRGLRHHGQRRFPAGSHLAPYSRQSRHARHI